ncbi:Cupin-2 domain-containing protein [Mycena chlorophos]|uniref:Cupin-2 domain-containing protein n=1 Tax=Mycena chlorophos TaxID=658473 RepID=A0A8H6TP76_MYCCL|nr:Cupin-2 domain-containing protein [Mycena chlorophos]
MSGPTCLKTLKLGKGSELRLFHDDSQPEDSLMRWYTEAVADGEPTSEAVYIPAHWHRNHSEHMSVLEGRIEATIDGRTKLMRAGDEFVIPRLAVHGFKGFKGERLVIRERADPGGDYKVLFFNDVFSSDSPFAFWHTMRAFYDGDTYPAMGLYFRFFDIAFVTIFGGIAKLFDSKKPTKIE